MRKLDIRILDERIREQLPAYATSGSAGLDTDTNGQVMHLLPQEFILDDQGAIRDPDGMLAAKLEAQVHMITAQGSVTQSVITAANRAGVEVTDTVYAFDQAVIPAVRR